MMPTRKSVCFALMMMVSVSCLAIPAYPQQPTPPTSPTAEKPTKTPEKPQPPRPNPDADGKYHVGDGVTGPILIFSVEPEFSERMRKQKVYGSCIVSLTVNSDGSVNDVHLLTSTPDLSDKKIRAAVMEMQNNCTKAVKQYRFTPATYQDKPVPVEMKVEISFIVF
jgi:TonB family protein